MLAKKDDYSNRKYIYFWFQVTSIRMQGLLLLLFAKQIHLPYIQKIQATYTRTGIFGYWVRTRGVGSCRVETFLKGPLCLSGGMR